MSLDTTLSDIADMILDTSQSVDIDVQMDERFARAMDYASRSSERLAKLFNPAIDVVKTESLRSDEDLQIINSLGEAGFTAAGRYAIKRKEEAFKPFPLRFKVKLSNVDNWKDSVKEKFPEASVTEISKSPIKGYTMYEMSIGEDKNVTFHVPTTSSAVSVGSIVNSNLDFQLPADDTVTEKKPNTDKNVFGGLDFDLNQFEVTDLEFANTPEKIRETYNGIWKKEVLDKIGQEAWNASSLSQRQQIVSDTVDATIRTLVDKYENTTSRGKLTGTLKDLVYTSEIKDSLKTIKDSDAWRDFMTTGKIPESGVSQDFVNAALSFKKLVEITEHLSNNADFLISNGKRVNTLNVAMDIKNRAEENTSQRETYFNKFPVVGKIYKFMTKNLSGLRTFTLNMFTPEVMANVVSGHKKNFLHQILNDDMIDADAKDAKFTNEVNNFFYESVPKDQHEKLRKYSDWLQEDKDKASKIAIKGLSSNVPVAKALSLYMMLRQSDVQGKINSSKTKVSFYDEINKKNVSSTIDSDQFMDSFEKVISKNPELQNVIAGIDATMEEIHSRTKDSAKNFTGTDLTKIPYYFPIRTGAKDSISNIEQKRRIEDFVGVKERSLTTNSTLRMEDAFQVMDGYIKQASKFNSYAEPISNIRKLIKSLDDVGNDSTKGAVSYMYDMIDSIQDYRQLQSLSDNQWDATIRKGMNNFTLAVLGWNPAVALKQVVSIVAAAPELGLDIVKSKNGRETAARILKSSYKNTKFKKGQIGQLNLEDPTLKEIMKLDPLFEQRFNGYIDRDQGEYRSANSNPFTKDSKKTKIFGKKFQMDKTMELIKIHDAAAIAWIYEDIKAKNKGISQDQLRKKLREVVMRTQPTYNVSSRTNLSRSNDPLMRLFTMFSSQRAKNMNMMFDSIIKYATNPDERNKQSMKATLLAIGVLSSIGIAVIDKLKYMLFGAGGDDEDMTDIVLDIGAMSMLNTMGNVYFAGQFAQMVDANLRNKPFGKSVEHPVFQTVGISAKAIADLTKGNFWKATDGALQTGFRLIGAPLWPYTNIAKKGAKSIGGSSGTSSSGKGSSIIQGEGATATERAAMYSRQTALIKANIRGRQQVAEFHRKVALQSMRDRAARRKAQTESLDRRSRMRDEASLSVFKAKVRAAEKLAGKDTKKKEEPVSALVAFANKGK